MLKKFLNLFRSPPLKKQPPLNSAEVGAFYNKTTDKFLEVYGDIIQAFRTNNVYDYLDYTIQNAELKGGPAYYFASKLNVVVDGITISDVQFEKANAAKASKTLLGNVNFTKGDYHNVDEIYGPEIFDRVVFLESFGHSSNKPLLIEKAFKVLKPGGVLYIKDLFKREHPNKEDGILIDKIVAEIDRAYCYHVADLHEVLATMRRLNFIILFVKTPEVKVGEFEHLTISNNFQELFDIAKIISWEDYIFPVDFYEIKVMKPPFDLSQQKHLYFLNRPEVVEAGK
jgi:SAM-dependent methyltransferase